MPEHRIKVLLVYHGAAWEPSRKLFEAIAAHDTMRLRVLAPKRGRDPASGRVLEIPHCSYGTYDLVTGRVHRAMQNFARPYVTGLMRQMIYFRPNVVFVMNEVFSDIYMQALRHRNLVCRRAKALFYGFENLVDPPGTKRLRLRWKLLRRWGDGGAYANSEGLKRVIAAGFPADNLMLTYWGVPLDAFKPQRNEALRRELGLSDAFVVGYVGRVVEEKGLGDVLDALGTLPANVKLLCVGDGPGLSTFRNQAATTGLNGRVTQLPRVPDGNVPAYINAMDALVLPSRTTPTWKEQFGRVLPEAMGCGVPVIGSDSGAIPEVIGDAGLIYSEGDSKAMAKAIAQLSDDAAFRRRLAERGVSRANEHFSCQAFAGKLVQLFEKVTG